jgi:hypothetical protein
LGFFPPIWHWTDTFKARIESSIDENSLERDWSSQPDANDGIASVTDPAALRAVLDEGDCCFQDWAKRAQNKHDPSAWEEGFKAGETAKTRCPYSVGTTQAWWWSSGRVEGDAKRQGLSYSRLASPTREFAGVIRLLRDVHQLLAEQKPLRASIILDLTSRLSRSKNWENLPAPLYERKRILDEVLLHFCYAMGQPKGLRGFAKAAQVYVANDWMYDRWLTKLLAHAMLSKLLSTVNESTKPLYRWYVGLSVVGGLVCLASTTVGVFIIVVTVLWAVVALTRIGNAQSELDRIIVEVEEDCFAGGVLAERLERLNSPRLQIPSILVELLRVQRC